MLCIDSLLDKGLIRKKKKGNTCIYVTTEVNTKLPNSEKSSPDKSFDDFIGEEFSSKNEKSSPSMVKKVHQESEKSSPNKIDNKECNKLDINSKSHSSRAVKKSYPQDYYKQIFNAYFNNYSEIWHNSSRYQNEFPEKPVINYKQMSKRIKEAFEAYGFEAVLEAVRTSKNHQFLIDSGYVMSFIFGPNELPILINKNYKNTAQKQNNFSNKKSLEDKIDLSDMAVYEEEAV